MTSGTNDLYPDGRDREPVSTECGKAGGTEADGKRSTAKTYDAMAYDLRVDAIRELIESFGQRYLTPEYTTYALNLCDKVSLTPDLDILRGQKTIWAAAIVHTIARLNLLFETNSELVLTPALICSHFKAVKSTVGNRASQIQKVCGISPGARGYCRREGGGAKQKIRKQMQLFGE